MNFTEFIVENNATSMQNYVSEFTNFTTIRNEFTNSTDIINTSENVSDFLITTAVQLFHTTLGPVTSEKI